MAGWFSEGGLHMVCGFARVRQTACTLPPNVTGQEIQENTKNCVDWFLKKNQMEGKNIKWMGYMKRYGQNLWGGLCLSDAYPSAQYANALCNMHRREVVNIVRLEQGARLTCGKGQIAGPGKPDGGEPDN